MLYPFTVMAERALRSPRSKRRAYLKGWLRGNALSAEVEGTDANVECIVSVFESEKCAAAWVALAKPARCADAGLQEEDGRTEQAECM